MLFRSVKGYPGLHDKATLIPRAAIPPPSFSGSDHENHQHGLIFEAGLDISKCVTRTGTEPFAKGYHTGIWAGVYETTSGKNVVSLKILEHGDSSLYVAGSYKIFATTEQSAWRGTPKSMIIMTLTIF